MIAPSDPDYKDTKLVKQGKITLSAPRKGIVDWASTEFNVRFVNAFCDVVYVNHVNRPRLTMILEHESDLPKFKDGWNFDKKKQKRIEDAFRKILDSQKIKLTDLFAAGALEVPDKRDTSQGWAGDLFAGEWSKVPEKPKNADASSQGADKPIDPDALFSVFSAFETVAKWEASDKIPAEKIDELKTSLKREELWTIEKGFGTPIFFFYTDDQSKAARANGTLKMMGGAYYELLAPYDEFKYFDPTSFSVASDSKENFDKNYQSNWFNYYR